ncbi:MAG: SIS domain-containing protein [Bacteroidales bacterium]|nr:SIS domain-containing protein [Bacteroidales bacterium]
MIDAKEIALESLAEASRISQNFINDPASAQAIAEGGRLIAAAISAGGKVMTCGNGGSLCDATHFAEELTGRFRNSRRPLPALAINDAAHITCVANDFSYAEVYSKYVEAVGGANDVLIGFSTSGNSANVVKAAEAAKRLGMKVIGMTRAGSNRLASLADVVIPVEHDGYSDRIQEMHILSVHIMIEIAEHLLGVAEGR